MVVNITANLIIFSVLSASFAVQTASAESCSSLEAKSLEILYEAEVKEELRPLFDQFTRSTLFVHQSLVRRAHADTIAKLTDEAILKSGAPANQEIRASVAAAVDAAVVSRALMTENQSEKFKKAAGSLQLLSQDAVSHTAQYVFASPDNLQKEIDTVAHALAQYAVTVQLPKGGNLSGQLVQLDQLYRGIATDPAMAAAFENKEVILKEAKGRAPQLVARGDKFTIQFDTAGWDGALRAFGTFGQHKVEVSEDDKANANLVEVSQSFSVIKLDDNGKAKWMRYDYTMLYGNPEVFRGIFLNGHKSKDWIANNSGKGILMPSQMKKQLGIVSDRTF